MSKKTRFNDLWSDVPQFSDWLGRKDNSPHEAYCKFCKATLTLGSMGRTAIEKHAQSLKHKNIVATRASATQNSILAFALRNRGEQPSTSGVVNTGPGSFTSSSSAACLDITHLPVVDNTSVVNDSASAAMSSGENVVRGMQQPMYNFVRGDEVTRAEVLWAVKCVMSHFSKNSASDMGDIFKLMFPDSSIAKKMSIGSTKLSYYITYGLAPYYHNQLLRQCLKCERVVVCFDEAFNKVAQRGQMDVCIRYWNDDSNSVSSRYFGSAFMGFASAAHIVTSFRETLSEVPLSKILQVSMDGPAVNWKFIDLLTSLEDQEVNLLEMGSCGLHVLNGAFQTGHKASGWQVNAYLRGIYYLFKDSPARRAQYTEITGSRVFPLRFCQVRWLQNSPCAERAVDILPHIKKYVENAKKKLPSTVSSRTVQELCDDKLAGAKLAFFASVAAQCEPFLRKYQTSAPMSPFLYEDIGNVLRILMKRFVKKSVMETTDTVAGLKKIDLAKKEIRCTYKEVDIGVGASRCLSAVSLSDTQRLTFRMQCIEFVSAAVSKIFDRSPLQYSIVRAISCLVPSIIANNRTLAENRMKLLVEIMHGKGYITAVKADKCRSQFSDLCGKASTSFLSKFQSYCRNSDKLDAFYYDVIGLDVDFAELFSVVKLVLILSHGNAQVESGFSINGDMLVENLHEESLVAQRVVYDAVQSAGGISSVQLEKDLLTFVRGSNSRYLEALERKRNAALETDKHLAAKKRAVSDIRALEIKKAKLVDSVTASNTEVTEIDNEIANLKKLK